MIRPRRNRKNTAIRGLIQETQLPPSKLIYPLFLIDGNKIDNPISSLPGMSQLSIDLISKKIEKSIALGVTTFCLFPVVDESLKNKTATYSYDEKNFYLKAATQLKKDFPDICLMSDVALDPYSSDGHDGLVVDGNILNDETLPILAKMSVAQAAAGFDIIGPSDMMDGRVGYIRDSLDQKGFTNTSIMSYTAKYASAFYGPFRDALDSAPKEGDKKTYQMDPANKLEAFREAQLDAAEGADFLMVKPALCYMDVIQLLKQNFDLPIAAYNVSGEYAMVKAAAEKGWLDYDAIMSEMLLSMHRAGADVILTYFAEDYARLYKSQS